MKISKKTRAIYAARKRMKEASYGWEQKPHGRKGCTIVIGMNAFIDLSVSPFLQVEGKETRKAE